MFQEFVAGDAFSCLMAAYDPVCVGTYQLEGSVPMLYGNITLNIGGSHVVKLPVDIQHDVTKMVDYEQLKAFVDTLASSSVSHDKFHQLETMVSSLAHSQAATQQVNERQVCDTFQI